MDCILSCKHFLYAGQIICVKILNDSKFSNCRFVSVIGLSQQEIKRTVHLTSREEKQNK